MSPTSYRTAPPRVRKKLILPPRSAFDQPHRDEKLTARRAPPAVPDASRRPAPSAVDCAPAVISMRSLRAAAAAAVCGLIVIGSTAPEHSSSRRRPNRHPKPFPAPHFGRARPDRRHGDRPERPARHQPRGRRLRSAPGQSPADDFRVPVRPRRCRARAVPAAARRGRRGHAAIRAADARRGAADDGDRRRRFEPVVREHRAGARRPPPLHRRADAAGRPGRHPAHGRGHGRPAAVHHRPPRSCTPPPTVSAGR